MLTTPTPEQLIALASAHQQSRWGKVDELLTAEIEAWVTRMLEQSDASQLHECRGRIKALKDFQSMVREAPETLEKLGRQTPL